MSERKTWIFFIAARFLQRNKRKKSKHFKRGRNRGDKGQRFVQKSVKNENSFLISFRLAVLGIFVGVFALTVIISVMNGFQLSFNESILEVSSYHVRVDN